MFLNFSNFRGRTSAGGGTSLGPKTGTSVGWGGIGKIFAGWGEPPQSPPQEKNPDSNNVSATKKNVKGSTTSSISKSFEVKYGRHFQNSISSKIVKENGKSSAAPSVQTFVEGNKL